MNADKYFINYFHPDDLSTPVFSDDNWGPSIPITLRTIPSADHFITVFMIRRSGFTFAPQTGVTQLSPQLDSAVTAFSEANLNNLPELVGDISIYPNPANESVNVKIGDADDKVAIKLLTLDGKLISTHVVANGIMSIDLSTLKRAAYMLVVDYPDGRTATRKFVKL